MDNIVEKPTHLKNWSLGNGDTEYKSSYDKTLLVPIPREERRKGYTKMYGTDIWTAFEFSTLLSTGLPIYKVLRIYNSCDSNNIFESKSLKLYLNSFNNTKFDSLEDALKLIETDLTELTGKFVKVEVVERFRDDFHVVTPLLEEGFPETIIVDYTYNPSLLKTIPKELVPSSQLLQTSCHSNLLRSNCEITNQPDWANIYISYVPNEVYIDPESLLQYIVSYRNHQEFHEPTCERIYQDLLKALNPKELKVVCQYTRRGGIDINPVRSMQPLPENFFLGRRLQQ